MKRISSIDFLRGVVMIMMALDHVRDFFHYDAFFFDPTDVTQTNPALFVTRFVTHYCAPVFVFLAGTSAYMIGQRKGRKELSSFLLKRGIWLIICELTIIKLAWNFNLNMSTILLQVIWLLGVAMVFMALFVYIKKNLMIVLSFIVIIGHNLFDQFNPESWSGLWTFLHVLAPIDTGFNTIFVAYPLLPWIFVMPLGYYFGELYDADFDPNLRMKWLMYLGITTVVLYFILRFINVYGDPYFWSEQTSWDMTLVSFFNVTKYPPSLLFLLITLGPTFFVLLVAEKLSGSLYDAVVTIGRVPMFFYIVHIYIIHLLAMIAVVYQGFPPSLMIIELFVSFTPELQGYGFNLLIVYVVWVVVVVGLYPFCVRYWNYKKNNRHLWWLSYL